MIRVTTNMKLELIIKQQIDLSNKSTDDDYETSVVETYCWSGANFCNKKFTFNLKSKSLKLFYVQSFFKLHLS